MYQIYQMCLDLVKANTKCVNPETKEILASSIFSLFLLKGNIILHKMPDILNNLTIYSDNRSVREVYFDEISKKNDSSHLRNAVACVTREYHFKGNVGTEKRSLIIPRKNIEENPITTVEKTTHELVHLLRFGDLKREGNTVILQEGIATKKYNDVAHTKSFKNIILEEAIVQDIAKKAVEVMLSYSGQIASPLMMKMNQSKASYHSTIYEAHVILLNYFLRDEIFQKIVDETMLTKSGIKLENYYNSIMKDDEAFKRLNYCYNALDQAIETNQAENAVNAVNCIKKECNQFLKKRDNRVVKKYS